MQVPMNSNSIDEVIARVVAWHNRHPLARRITAEQVNDIGVVALPFVTTAERSSGPLPAELIAPREVVEPSFAPPTLDEVLESSDIESAKPLAAASDPSLTEHAMARSSEAAPESPFAAPSAAARPWAMLDPRRWLRAIVRLLWPGSRAGFQRIFNEDFMPPLSPAKVARWALLHGNTTRPGGADWPLRKIAADAAMRDLALANPGVEPLTLYLITAAVDTPSGRLRLLLGRSGLGSVPPVIGPRALSRLRMSLAGLLAAVAVALIGWGGYSGQEQAPVSVAASGVIAGANPASQASSKPAPIQLQIDAVPAPEVVAAAPQRPASAVLAAPSTPLAQAVQRAASAPVIAATAAPASSTAASASTAPIKAAAPGARDKQPTPAKLPPSLALGPHPSLFDAPQSINEMAVALHNKSWIPESVKQAALLEGRRLRAEAAEAAAQPASAPAADPLPAADPSDAKASPALEVKPAASAVQAKPAASGVKAAGPRYYALVTKPSLSKMEAQARMILLRAAAANAIAPRGSRIELLHTQGGWQAVWWPFAKREDAERARHLLTVRGVLVQLVEF